MIDSKFFSPIQLPFPALLTALMVLCVVALANPLDRAIAQQSADKKSTPDPYFNSKNQTQDTPSSLPAEKELLPQTIGKSPLAETQRPSSTQWQAAGWEPPNTNVSLNGKTTERLNSTGFLPPSETPTSNSIIRAQRSADTNGVPVLLEKNDGSNEFSADLSNLKPPQKHNVVNDSNTAAPVPPPSVAPTVTLGSTKVPKIPEDATQFEPSQLLAMVGSEPIFVGDLMFEVNQLIEKFMPTAPQSIKDQESKKLIQRLLPKFVDSKLLYIGTLQKLPKGADVTKILEQAGKEFDDKAMQKMMDSAGLKSPSEFDAQLRAQGSSLRKMRLSWSQDQLTKFFLSQQLDVNKEITHQAMLDDYRQHLSEYAVPARAKWEQVMIRFDRTSSRAEAEKMLVEMGNQIVYGANFAAVAKKNSHGFRAAHGGQHDWTTQDALVLKELDRAIFELPIGELSDKIETAEGFHIVRVLERTVASHKSFLEAQVEIKERLLEEKRTAAFDKYLKKLRQEIQVEYPDHSDLAHPTALADRRSNRVDQVR